MVRRVGVTELAELPVLVEEVLVHGLLVVEDREDLGRARGEGALQALHGEVIGAERGVLGDGAAPARRRRTLRRRGPCGTSNQRQELHDRVDHLGLSPL